MGNAGAKRVFRTYVNVIKLVPGVPDVSSNLHASESIHNVARKGVNDGGGGGVDVTVSRDEESPFKGETVFCEVRRNNKKWRTQMAVPEDDGEIVFNHLMRFNATLYADEEDVKRGVFKDKEYTVVVSSETKGACVLTTTLNLADYAKLDTRVEHTLHLTLKQQSSGRPHSKLKLLLRVTDNVLGNANAGAAHSSASSVDIHSQKQNGVVSSSKHAGSVNSLSGAGNGSASLKQSSSNVSHGGPKHARIDEIGATVGRVYHSPSLVQFKRDGNVAQVDSYAEATASAMGPKRRGIGVTTTSSSRATTNRRTFSPTNADDSSSNGGDAKNNDKKKRSSGRMRIVAGQSRPEEASSDDDYSSDSDGGSSDADPDKQIAMADAKAPPPRAASSSSSSSTLQLQHPAVQIVVDDDKQDNENNKQDNNWSPVQVTEASRQRQASSPDQFLSEFDVDGRNRGMGSISAIFRDRNSSQQQQQQRPRLSNAPQPAAVASAAAASSTSTPGSVGQSYRNIFQKQGSVSMSMSHSARRTDDIAEEDTTTDSSVDMVAFTPIVSEGARFLGVQSPPTAGLNDEDDDATDAFVMSVRKKHQHHSTN